MAARMVKESMSCRTARPRRSGSGVCDPGRSHGVGNRTRGGLLVVALLATGCASKPVTARPTPRAPLSTPSASAIESGRFVHGVQLDNGNLTVTPAGSTQRPGVSLSAATTLVQSDLAAAGMSLDHRLGFGQITISSRLTGSRLPVVHHATGWVGFLTGGAIHCPALPAGSAPDFKAPPTPGYTAIVVLGSGHTVLAYRSRTSTCSQPPTGPTVSQEPQVLSVPWTLVSLSGLRINYRYRVPLCDTSLLPLPQVSGNATTGAASLTVQLDVPYSDSRCPLGWRTASVLAGPGATAGSQPPGLSRLTTVGHGQTGPVDLLNTGAAAYKG